MEHRIIPCANETGNVPREDAHGCHAADDPKAAARSSGAGGNDTAQDLRQDVASCSVRTVVIDIDPADIDAAKIRFCADVIKRGGLVCFPTETVYGLGADAFNESAVRNIFAAKGRPSDNPLIVHVSDMEMIRSVSAADSTQTERLSKLCKAFWPGPLTVIVNKDPAVPDAVTCGLDTVGIRMPEDPVARKLIRLSGPVAAPSANLSGKPSPSRAAHVIEDLTGRVDVIISGGDAKVGVESTVLDVTGETPLILRPGAVTREQIAGVLGACDEADWKRSAGRDDRPRSPGMKYRHYSPNAEVIVYDGHDPSERRRIMTLDGSSFAEKGLKVGILTTDEGTRDFGSGFTVLTLGCGRELTELTHSLFARLREFDELKTDVVLAEAIPEEGLGDAFMNRLYRAAGGRVINTDGRMTDITCGDGSQRS